MMTTMGGLILGVVIVIVAMSLNASVLIFVNIPGLLIVVGGTIAVTMMRFSIAEIKSGIGMSFAVLKAPKDIQNLNELVDLTENILRASRQNGLLSLESFEIKHEFYANGVRMLVDGYSSDVVLSSLREQNYKFNSRAEVGSGVFDAIGDAAPAFGMIGTLVGLIQMLANLDDPASIGPAMAVAMLTTLYGAMIANMFALPMSTKITATSHIESVQQLLIIDAIKTISLSQNPAIMRDILSCYLAGGKKIEQEDG